MFCKEYMKEAFDKTTLIAGLAFLLVTVASIIQPTWNILNLQEVRFNIFFMYLVVWIGTYIKILNKKKK